MKAEIVITQQGTIRVMVQEGSYADGREAIERLLTSLKAQGIDLELDGPIEQHRHSAEEVATHEHVHHTH